MGITTFRTLERPPLFATEKGRVNVSQRLLREMILAASESQPLLWLSGKLEPNARELYSLQYKCCLL